ncbi:MAG: hypothetical protein ABW216_17210 [Candidatus Rokuibacteriota bacterium]
MLAGLIEVMGEERGVRTRRRSMDREQRARDGGVGSLPAIQKLGSVGDLLREGMPERVLPRRLGGTEKLRCRKALERRGELGRGQVDDGAQHLDRHVSTDHGRGLEHGLVPVREPIDARRQDGLNGLGQRDLLDRGGQPVGAAFTAEHAALGERANHLLDEEWVAASLGLDAGAQRCEHVVGSEPVVEQHLRILGTERRKGETLDPGGPRGPILRPRGREQQDPATGRLRCQEALDEHLQRHVARRVEPVQVIDPEQRELATSASPDQFEK